MSAGGILADTMANLKYTVVNPEAVMKSPKVQAKIAAAKAKAKAKEKVKEKVKPKSDDKKKFKDFLKSVREQNYHSYTDDRDEEVMYSAGEIIETLKMIHSGDQLEDLGFADIDEAKAFYKDWYLTQWVMLEGGDDKSKIILS